MLDLIVRRERIYKDIRNLQGNVMLEDMGGKDMYVPE